MQPNPRNVTKKLASLPKDELEAVQWVLPLLDLETRVLRRVPQKQFMRAWSAIAFLYVGLHPDSALDHGTRVVDDGEDYPLVSRVEARLLKPYYEESGWPVVLAPVAAEAWRRHGNGRLRDDDLYCSDAQMAGMVFRSHGEPPK